MDITRLDITILVATTIGVILMSFTFPALGLTGDKTNESDVPEFSIDSSRFDFSGDFPARPGSASTQQGDSIVLGNSTFLEGDTTYGYEVVFIENPNESAQSVQWTINSWYDGDVVEQEKFVHDTDGQSNSTTISNNVMADMEITVTTDTIQNKGDSQNFTANGTYIYCLDNGGCGGSGAFDNIPIVSDLLDAGSDLAAMVGWIGQTIWWFTATIVETLLNGLGVLVDIAIYMFDLLTWLTDTYLAIQSSNNISAWAAVILMIPAVIMMAEWAKIALVMVEVIWIG